jgi:hypothetical protein
MIKNINEALYEAKEKLDKQDHYVVGCQDGEVKILTRGNRGKFRVL